MPMVLGALYGHAGDLAQKRNSQLSQAAACFVRGLGHRRWILLADWNLPPWRWRPRASWRLLTER
eukprot:6759168-Alexandrium_andersonii.AAC.1